VTDELFAIAGAAFLVFGVWKIYHPAAFIVLGLILIYVAANASPTRRGRG